MFDRRRELVLHEVKAFVMACFFAAISVAAHVSRESWFLVLVAFGAVAAGWFMFKEIWSKHADGKDAIREAWRIQLRLWLVAIVAIFLLWLRFSLAK